MKLTGTKAMLNERKFFLASCTFLRLRFFCIISWSRPLITIVMNAPDMNCLKKWLLLPQKLEKSKIWNCEFEPIAEVISRNDMPSSSLIAKMVNITANTRKKVCMRSVHTMDLMPPLTVYAQIRKTDIIALSANGRPRGWNTVICKTRATIKRRKPAPISLEIRNNIALVL